MDPGSSGSGVGSWPCPHPGGATPLPVPTPGHAGHLGLLEASLEGSAGACIAATKPPQRPTRDEERFSPSESLAPSLYFCLLHLTTL